MRPTPYLGKYITNQLAFRTQAVFSSEPNSKSCFTLCGGSVSFEESWFLEELGVVLFTEPTVSLLSMGLRRTGLCLCIFPGAVLGRELPGFG